MRIATYTIAKNEAPRIARALHSARGADYRLVVDTGSTDGTIAQAKLAGAKVYPVAISPWRFDTARNTALALLPADIDVCVCLEADEVLVPEWRKHVEDSWTGGVTQLTYHFEWDGGVTFLRDRIHARHGYRWHGTTHEALHVDPRAKHKVAHIPAVLVQDLPPDGRCGSTDYLNMLWAWCVEEPHSTRAAFYYAREHMFRANVAKSIVEWKRFLSLSPTWPVEREYAFRSLSRLHRNSDRLAAIRYAKSAVFEMPTMRCPRLVLAEAYITANDWMSAKGAVDRALDITDRANVFTEDAGSWGDYPLQLKELIDDQIARRNMVPNKIRRRADASPIDPNPRDGGELNAI